MAKVRWRCPDCGGECVESMTYDIDGRVKCMECHQLWMYDQAAKESGLWIDDAETNTRRRRFEKMKCPGCGCEAFQTAGQESDAMGLVKCVRCHKTFSEQECWETAGDTKATPAATAEDVREMKEYVAQKAIEIHRGIMAQRDEILTAFIAKYGYRPDEIEQVVETTAKGVRWFVRKR